MCALLLTEEISVECFLGRMNPKKTTAIFLTSLASTKPSWGAYFCYNLWIRLVCLVVYAG
jgi:hypothetical protein